MASALEQRPRQPPPLHFWMHLERTSCQPPLFQSPCFDRLPPLYTNRERQWRSVNPFPQVLFPDEALLL